DHDEHDGYPGSNLFDNNQVVITSIKKVLAGEKEKHANVIYLSAFDKDGNAVTQGLRSSSEPARDVHIMEAAIEFYYAVQRGVDITPEVLWRRVMGKEWESKPIDMVLYCPKCNTQHIDAPERDLAMDFAVVAGFTELSPGYRPWTNPPHKSHLCQNKACG